MSEQDINMRADAPITSTSAQQGEDRVACYNKACNWRVMAPRGCTIISHTGGCAPCDSYLNHIMDHIEEKTLDISPMMVVKGLCDTWPTLFECVELNAREEGQDSFRPRYNRIIDELKKVEFRHKAALKEHAEVLKNANKMICKLREQLAASLASNISQAPSSSLGERTTVCTQVMDPFNEDMSGYDSDPSVDPVSRFALD